MRTIQRTTLLPGQSFTSVHLNRVIKKYDLDVICVSDTYLEGTCSGIYPEISR
ncbi:MAG: hypothetical protein KJ950_07495 [Proteobacteria bacterium]|nr:hypothetical protein [Pseudomonadota bacterium]MBU1687088.1 hypothetical protein [Pseudomonadota bacterium]